MASAETSTAPWLDPEAVVQAVAEAAGEEVVGVEHHHHHHDEDEMSGAIVDVVGGEQELHHEEDVAAAAAYASLDGAAYIDTSYAQPEEAEAVHEYAQEQPLDEHGQVIVDEHLQHADVEMSVPEQTQEEYEAAAQAAAEAEAYGVEAGQDEQMVAAAMLEGASVAPVTSTENAAQLTEEGEVYRSGDGTEVWQQTEEAEQEEAEEGKVSQQWDYQAQPQHHLQHQHHLQRSVPLQEYGEAFAAYSNVSNTAAAAALGLLQQATSLHLENGSSTAASTTDAAAHHEAVVLAAAAAQQQEAQAAVAAAAQAAHHAHQDPSGGVQRRQKFKRSRTGCLVCRKRKVKCSQDGQPCKQCKIGKRDCHYEENPPKRKRRTRGEQEAEAAAAAALVAQQGQSMQEQGEASGSALQEIDPQTGLPYQYVEEGGAGSASWTTEFQSEGQQATEEEQAAYYDEAQHAALVEGGGEVYTAEQAPALLEQQQAIDAEAEAAHDAHMALHHQEHEHQHHHTLHDEHGQAAADEHQQQEHVGVEGEEYRTEEMVQHELDAATQLAHAEHEAVAVAAADPLSYVQKPHDLEHHEHAVEQQEQEVVANEHGALVEQAHQLEGAEGLEHAQVKEDQNNLAAVHEPTYEEELEQQLLFEQGVEQEQFEQAHAYAEEEDQLPQHDEGLGVEGEAPQAEEQ